MRRRDDRGQAAIELAIAMPLLIMVLLGAVQVVVVVGDVLAVQLAAREAARAAAVSAQPSTAASGAALRATALRPLRVSTAFDGATVTATVRYVAPTNVPLVGALLPSVPLEASVTMVLEPP